MNVIWIEEWLRRKRIDGDPGHGRYAGGQCWYPTRQNEKGDWEWEPVEGVGEPICVYREPTDDVQIS
jgi:hypothetical protein